MIISSKGRHRKPSLRARAKQSSSHLVETLYWIASLALAMTASNILMYKDMLILGVLSKEFINSAICRVDIFKIRQGANERGGWVSRKENSPVDCFSGERPAMDGRAGCGSKDGCMQPVSRAQGNNTRECLNSQ